MSRITNRRWAHVGVRHRLVGGAVSAADTVYSVTPLYHPSGLMTSIGGAIAGGARLAMASRVRRRTTFWDEVRRYGVTVASYTWTLLHEHRRGARRSRASATIRCGCSSARGCRAGCGGGWSGASRRPGWSSSTPRPRPGRSWSTCAAPSPGRWAGRCRAAPRCGSPPTTSRPGSSMLERGRVRAALRGRRGRDAARRASSPSEPLEHHAAARACSPRDDAWLSTGDLFRRDADGDYWRRRRRRRRDPHRRRARCSPRRSAMRSSDMPAVDLAVAYGVARTGDGPSSRWPRSTLRPEHAADRAASCGHALRRAARAQRPAVVQVVDGSR